MTRPSAEACVLFVFGSSLSLIVFWHPRKYLHFINMKCFSRTGFKTYLNESGKQN
ncbi:hypothetical protein Hanom_Chr01g00072461 [Helianthus anomalus]